MNNASKPVYLKLRDIISESILDGEYKEGDMLPSVRTFAADQGANPLTVAKAYQGFQEDGLVTVKRGVGMFVATGAVSKLRDAQRQDFVKNIWPPVERQMKRLDISIDDLLKSDA
ncbi:GntR family transcriptional regulator [Parasphingorhabdus halotolerans]|uniref:GntR family transcriptional regulator n=1 Tax=Parasphingorhabdus halotolerans TaxID=2725558 RepID=A0A6H2DJL6_9SPHN|nr:GntR family transcriptional regulator [Parasphingorhabdus halotolerans]QJB68580.1 GntR family transcriptional regulator [Parasphingorhabdus halotolerans]